jgi:excinuclease ABC subunit C
MKLATKATTEAQLFSLTDFLQLDGVITKVECFDISHTTGDKCIAACVVFCRDGFDKKQYRRFNISGITPGDDYAAIGQAVTRHYARAVEEAKKLPDLVVIDGGKGQLRIAKECLNELGLTKVPVVGIAKGLGRKSGEEKIFLNLLKQPLAKERHSPAMYLLQVVRDEAHRFAITGHRARKRKTLLQSDLEAIEGIGPAKKKNLIRQFGGIQEVKRASIEDLLTIKGINKALARRIYNFFNAG